VQIEQGSLAEDTAATGMQYALRRGEAEAVVVGLAGALRTYRVGGEDFTEPYGADEIPPAGNGIQMTPWPNRVADARWEHAGTVQQLDITEPGRGHASHGLLRNTQLMLESKTPERVVLRGEIHPQHGWPFRMTHRVEYRLEADGALTVTQTLANHSSQTAPAAFGSHPFLRIGDIPSEALSLTVDASRWIEADPETLIPRGIRGAAGTAHDFRSGRTVGVEALDVCLTGLGVVEGGRHEARLTAPDGRTLTLWSDPVFAYTHVFVTDRLPGRDVAVAVEPMTAPANALNSGEGLHRLEPGQSLTGSWGLIPPAAERSADTDERTSRR
jgi:aldose 1-epimerase